jgi:hypothetical protein
MAVCFVSVAQAQSATSAAQPVSQAQPVVPQDPGIRPGDAEWVDFDSLYKLPASGTIDQMSGDQAKQKLEQATAKDSKELGNSLADFKKGAGLGITIAPDASDQVDEAFVVDGKIVATKKNTNAARMMFEFHQLFTSNVFVEKGRKAAREQIENCGKDPIQCPMFGIGPFVALQMSDDNSVSSVGVGIMFGVRNDPRKDTSFNFGIGVQWDSKVKKLADGFEAGKPLPTGEKEIRFVEKGEARLMFGISLGF